MQHGAQSRLAAHKSIFFSLFPSRPPFPRAESHAGPTTFTVSYLLMRDWSHTAEGISAAYFAWASACRPDAMLAVIPELSTRLASQ